MQSLVSVVIPAYNSAGYIREAIDSALRQSYQPIEIIVVDDGSQDNTQEVVRPYMKKLKYIYKENGGPASARNLGIKNAQGEYIAFLDADDLWLAEKVDKQVDLLKQDRSADLVHCHCVGFKDGVSQLFFPKQETNNGSLSGFIFPKLFWGNFIANSSVIVRKECFQKVGLFDEARDFIAVEDYDLWLRISKDCKVGYINQTLAKYRIRKKGISRNADDFYFRQKKVIEKTIKNCPEIEKITGIAISRRFAKLYFEYGLDLLKDKRLKEARVKFLSSLKYYPYNMRGLINMLKCLLPLKLFVALREMRTKLFSMPENKGKIR